LAIAALVAGILSLVCSVGCLGVLIGPAAVVMGFISRRRIRDSVDTLGGAGIAIAGLLLGLVGFVASVIWLVLVLRANEAFLRAPFLPT
jgi:hypothetical protein